MKNIILVAMVIVASAFAPEPEPMDIYEEIGKGIRSGNAKSLSVYFAANVDLTILDKEGMYSKQQAELVVQDFFNKHKPNGYTLKHKSAQPGGAQYCIGSLTTTAGETYQVYYLLKNIGGTQLIQQFNIEAK
jgi:hypothetical protein